MTDRYRPNSAFKSERLNGRADVRKVCNYMLPTPGPNHPCPCGSVRKYKKCCGGLGRSRQPRVRPATAEEVARFDRLRREQEEKELARFSKFGGVNPVVSTAAGGQRVVRVGDHLWYSPENTTFPEFLFYYLYMQLGNEWHTEQTAKSPDDRHVIRSWFEGYFSHLAEMAKTKSVDASGVLWLKPNGLMKSLIDLAYDLYILRDHLLLRDRLVRRLKDARQFQGARYEAFVTAAMIRAGFAIDFEDEESGNRKCPEFIATDKVTGSKFAVEAKSHHRQGVLGAVEGNNYNLRVVPLINAALAKKSDLPMIVFIDLNLPAHEGEPTSKPWYSAFMASLRRIPEQDDGGYDFAAAIFTNIPSHYSVDSSPAPKGDVVLFGSKVGRNVLSEDMKLRLHASLTDFAHVPATFDEAM